MNSFRSFFFVLTCVHGIFTAPASAQTLPDYLPTDGLVAWYPFNGNANDESGNGNDGVVNGATLTADRDGNPNAAYSFDGVDDMVSCAGIDAISGAQQLSVSIWFKTESTTDFNRLLGQENTCNQINSGFAIAFGSADAQTLRFLLRNGANQYGFIPNNEIPMGIWNQITLIYDGLGASDLDKCKVYLNGCLQVLTVMNGPLPSTLPVSELDTPFEIAASTCNGSENFFFDGTLDDIAIYNRALSAEEVQTLYVGASDFHGCTYADACNYNPGATVDDGSCNFPVPNYDCSGNCLLDLNNNGLCDLEEVAGCTNVDAINYNTDATLDDGSCVVTCKGDFDNDGQITINDLLGFLAAFGNQCAGAGCMDPAGCNYDPNATFDLGYCDYPAEFFNCEGAPINDADGDGIPDELEVAGCTNTEACNYDALATDDNGNCELPAEFFNCQGAPINDADGDGIPDELEVAGCTNPEACNYDALATYDNDNCELPAEFFSCDGTPVNDADGDGVPDELEVLGCTDPTADNYDESATEDDGSCSFLSGLQVGDAFEGGLVAYIYQDGDPGFIESEVHGFVVTDFNLADNIAWGCSGTFMGTSSALGSGMANTIQIVNSCDEPSFAAKLCYDLNYNGYSDWWLPSRDELQKIYNSRVVLGIASSVHYWSSTDCSDVRARVLNFANGGWFNCSSHTTNRKVLSPYSNGSTAVRRVRAIRYF